MDAIARIESWIENLIKSLLALPDLDHRKQLLTAYAAEINPELIDALKHQADEALRAEVQLSLQIAELICYAAELVHERLYLGLGLIAKGNVFGLAGLGEYDRAIAHYDQATAIYQEQGHAVGAARAQIGKIFVLAHLGRFQEAEEIGTRIAGVFKENREWLMQGNVYHNLGVVLGRQGKDDEALAYFDQAKECFVLLGDEGKLDVDYADFNRAIHLRNVGHFEESIQIISAVEQSLVAAGHTISAIHAQQNRAQTYFVVGRYNEALELLHSVRKGFLADGRRRDAILTELYITDSLLQMRRFQEVLAHCHKIREEFTEIGLAFEVTLTHLNKAVALAGLRRYQDASSALDEARHYFVTQEYPVWAAYTETEKALILQLQSHFAESLEIAINCDRFFDEHHLPYHAGRAKIIASQAAAALEQAELARDLATEALALGESKDMPGIVSESRRLLGMLSAHSGEYEKAFSEYEFAIQALERLRGRLMIEFRVSFLEDKQEIYAEAVDLCLRLGWVDRAIEYVERAKSRALVDLLAFRVDVGVQSRKAADQPLVEELTALCADRDRLYRSWEGQYQARHRGLLDAEGESRPLQHEVLSLESRITELWHELLIRNADYASDASLWQVRADPFQAEMDGNTLLLEYFVIGERFIVFLCSRESIEVQRLDLKLSEVRTLLQRLRLSMVAVPDAEAAQAPLLLARTQRVLQHFHTHLIAPLQSKIAPFERLIIVPHGPLHYAPFQAFYDGKAYLIEAHEISYLPNAGFLTYVQGKRPTSTRVVAFGYSSEGRLPATVEEARRIMALGNAEVYLEEQATKRRLQEAAVECAVLHLATHAEFRSDNPLFSGLLLADGWCTTLDIFNLRLKGALVTLSACQTGRSVIGGGDELLGLMRAFSFAGASSLLLSHWPVEDQSTARMMDSFYSKVATGISLSAALRQSQCEFIGVQQEGAQHDENALAHPEMYRHPYYWASFILVGRTENYFSATGAVL
jgi:CHAT domain-containing protein